MRFSLRAKTIIGIATIEAALLLALVITATNFMGERANEDLVKFARTTSTLFATTTKDAVLSFDLASLDSFVAEVLKNPDIAYARVVGGQGEVFAEGGAALRSDTPFRADVDVAGVDDGVFDAFAEIEEGGEVYGRVEIGVSVSAIVEAMGTIQNWTASIAVVEMLLVALFSYVLGAYLTGQLSELTTAAGAVSRSVRDGRFQEIRVAVRGRDELADVAQAFNTLVENLSTEYSRRESYQRDLEALNQTLETRVERRTQALQASNDELRESNSALRNAQTQLLQSEKMASIGQLAAGVAHEINTPIGFVKSNLGTLKEYAAVYREVSTSAGTLVEAESVEQQQALRSSLHALLEEEDIAYVNEDVQDLVGESIAGLERVKEIVDGLKLFARSDDTGMELTNINDCIATTLKMVGGELKARCEVIADLEDVPLLVLHAGKITQVMTNLLVNAGQAIDGRGQITITSAVRGDQVAVVVSDDGPGIPPDVLGKLFDPFFTTKPPGEGTGLGLSISYGILQEHGGSISAASEPGCGASFTLLFPIPDADLGDEPATPEAALSIPVEQDAR
ncbi:MAG: ATP-binding protein [Pseudomonadota bacterium]